ncbi:large ribosomal subunit protein uL14m [Drosophila sulfurigaster albostrigata]|uniref:Large ribosomal subunit protein uL14m n=1 Tax=Drosophila albomicans TaxID=7291 RepID=A0A6P8X8T5_DROAB|nr:39S ribosomal protein L14, mitochondrial [Drosophila albomicans]XP_060662558.1 large ribosomal subunit protein uL14m [Drosophila nasuta]XP_062141370.1 large ribosomal subunit protein uL14m [Drosophila sulfurigaster albostrigata]
MAQILLRNITRASNSTLLTTSRIGPSPLTIPAVAAANSLSQQLHTTSPCCEIRKLARLRVVDNSDLGKRAMAEGRPPRCIHVYNKRGVGLIGDKVLVAIKGQMKKGILVGLKQKQRLKQPQFDSNNLVLIDDNGSPLGTRIHVPIPTVLRTILKEKTLSKGADYTKVLAIASRYV